MANHIISEANDALEDLSGDPKAQTLARWREDQLKLYRVELATAERRGGRAGRIHTLRTSCRSLQIELTEAREKAICADRRWQSRAIHIAPRHQA